MKRAREAAREIRSCPFCSRSMVWHGSRRWRGISFDYYEPCPTCAALVCFNRADKTFEVLIAGVAPLAGEPAHPMGIDSAPTDERH
jgi:endogenous inhibitor of DNA gyrase (YacG/DUF329 family)